MAKADSLSMYQAQFLFSMSKTRAEFYEDVAAAIGDGEQIYDYLVKRRDRAKELKDPLGPLFVVWADRMLSGNFSHAIGRNIPTTERMSIAAAETAVSLQHDLQFLAEIVRGVALLKKSIIVAMIVPLMLSGLLVGMVYGFSTYFVPILTQTMPVEKWPASGQMLLKVSHIASNYGLLIVVAAIALLSLFFWLLPRWFGPNRRMVDEYLPFSIYRAFNGALALVSIATLMVSNGLAQSLERAGEFSNAWTSWHLKMIRRRLDTAGGNPGRAFDTGLLPKKILLRIIDRAERTDFSDAMRSIAAGALVDTQKNIAASATALNVVMLLVVGGFFAVMLLGFLDTVYAVQSSLGKM